MSDNDSENIKLQMMEIEKQYKEKVRFFDLLEDVLSRSVSRTNTELDSNDLSRVDFEMVKELNDHSRFNLARLADDRNQARYEYDKKMEYYKDSLDAITKEIK